MWKFAPFPEFINDLARCDAVRDVHIINNEITKTPDFKFHPKIKVHDFPENTYVNPAWNYGVSVSECDKVCVMNDDVIYDSRIIYRAEEFLDNEGVGLIGICPGEASIGQVPITTGRIFIQEIEHMTFGFGGMFFFNKSEWVHIPDGIKIWFGDNFQFEVMKIKGLKNYLINDSLFMTRYGTTSGPIEGHVQIFESDKKIFHEAMGWSIRELDNREFSEVIEEEYQRSCETPSDINEHLPALRAFAEKCTHVTEFGVRNGQSTRAFLASGSALRSYDLYIDGAVKILFDRAKNKGRDVEYSIGNTLEIDIEPTDMLFIDTEHSTEQVRGELNLHGDKVRKYIAFHDTWIFRESIMPAIEEFMNRNKSWFICYRADNNNGLLILEKRDV